MILNLFFEMKIKAMLKEINEFDVALEQFQAVPESLFFSNIDRVIFKKCIHLMKQYVDVYKLNKSLKVRFEKNHKLTNEYIGIMCNSFSKIDLKEYDKLNEILTVLCFIPHYIVESDIIGFKTEENQLDVTALELAKSIIKNKFNQVDDLEAAMDEMDDIIRTGFNKSKFTKSFELFDYAFEHVVSFIVTLDQIDAVILRYKNCTLISFDCHDKLYDKYAEIAKFIVSNTNGYHDLMIMHDKTPKQCMKLRHEISDKIDAMADGLLNNVSLNQAVQFYKNAIDGSMLKQKSLEAIILLAAESK